MRFTLILLSIITVLQLLIKLPYKTPKKFLLAKMELSKALFAVNKLLTNLFHNLLN